MEIIPEKLKLPSNWMLVSPESIWKYLIAISKTGNVFTKEQLIKSGLYTSNDDNISRNLSYLKYLELIDEERYKGKEQRFKVLDNRDVRDIFYELKANREDGAKMKFKIHLEKHSLFTTLHNDFFLNEKNKTLNEFEHFLRDRMPGKTPQYYQKGGEFLIKLLKLASLAELNGNDITLLEVDNNKDYNSPQSNVIDSNKAVASSQESNIITPPIVKGSYNIRIQSPDMNVEITIKNLAHLRLVESFLETIKTELEGQFREQKDSLE